MGLLQLIFNFVIWIFVPGILVLLVKMASSVHKRAEDARHRAATRAGFWAGFMLFIISLVYQVGIFLKTGFPQNEIYQGFDIWLALTGALASVLLFAGRKTELSPRASGLIVLALTFLAFWSLLHYLLVRTYNEILLSLILGITFGVLAHFAVTPSSIREFLKF